MPRFLTPEQAARELGTTKTTIKRFARLTGICTRLERNRIAFDESDLHAMHLWIKEQQAKPPEAEPGEEIDYF